jgi:hypothetical protein
MAVPGAPIENRPSPPGILPTSQNSTPLPAGALPVGQDIPRSTASASENSAASSPTNTVEADSADSHTGSGNQDSGQNRQSDFGPEKIDLSTRALEAKGMGIGEAIFELPPASELPRGLPGLEARLFDTLDDWFPEDAIASGAANNGASARSSGRRAIAAAWLRSLRSPSSSLAPVANQWNEVRIDLRDGAGAVRIRARRDAADQLTVQVQTSDPQTRAQLNAAAESLEDQLRERYGADVDLSFGSESGPENQDRSRYDERRRARQSAPSLLKSSASGVPHRRGADRVWVG